MSFARLTFSGLLLAAVAALSSNAAHALTVTYKLSVSDPAANLAAGPYGTITVVENLNGSLTVTETLAAGFRIHDGNANHNALAFSLVGSPAAVTISGVTTGFDAILSGVDAPPFGSYEYALDCTTACGSGFSGGFVGPLSFTLSAATPLTAASLQADTYLGQQIFFSSDLVGSNGNTGNVGAIISPAVPEPSTWAMMILGFAGVGFLAYRRRSQGTALRIA